MLGVLFAPCLDIFVVIFCKNSCGLWMCLIFDSAVHLCRFWWKLFSERRVEPGVFERVLELAWSCCLLATGPCHCDCYSSLCGGVSVCVSVCLSVHDHEYVLLSNDNMFGCVSPHRILCVLTTHHSRFTALFSGPPAWASARGELLDFIVQGKINRGRHIDYPAGHHSILTNQCPPPTFPIFTGRMPFLLPKQQCQSTAGNMR